MANFGMLIEICEEEGWDKVIAALEKIVLANENLQAELFSGGYKQQKQAQELSKTIIKQNITISKLKQYHIQNKLKKICK